MNSSGIYKILNTKTNDFYIGSAGYFNDRWSNHKYNLRRNKHGNIYLQRAWNKYTEWNFDFIIIEVCEIEQLIKREQYYIDTLKPKYNLKPIAGSNRGYKASVETKAKMSEARKGFKHTEEAKAKMKLYQSSRSIEHETNIQLGKIGHIVTEETRIKIGKANKGKRYRARLDKWPHEKGAKCKCNECKEKRNAYLREWFYKNKYGNFIMVNLNV